MHLLAHHGYSTEVVLSGVAVFLEAARRGLRHAQETGSPTVALEVSVAELDVMLRASELYLRGLSVPLDGPATPAPADRRGLRLVAQASQ